MEKRLSYDLTSIYSVDMSLLAQLMEEARRGYDEYNKPHVIVHSIENMGMVCESVARCPTLAHHACISTDGYDPRAPRRAGRYVGECKAQGPETH